VKAEMGTEGASGAGRDRDGRVENWDEGKEERERECLCHHWS